MSGSVGFHRGSPRSVEHADADRRPEMHGADTRLGASPTMQPGEAWRGGQGSPAIPTWAGYASVDHSRVLGQVRTAYESTSEFPPIASGGRNIWEVHPRSAPFHSGIFKQRACVPTQTSAVTRHVRPSNVILGITSCEFASWHQPITKQPNRSQSEKACPVTWAMRRN